MTTNVCSVNGTGTANYTLSGWVWFIYDDWVCTISSAKVSGMWASLLSERPYPTPMLRNTPSVSLRFRGFDTDSDFSCRGLSNFGHTWCRWTVFLYAVLGKHGNDELEDELFHQLLLGILLRRNTFSRAVNLVFDKLDRKDWLGFVNGSVVFAIYQVSVT